MPSCDVRPYNFIRKFGAGGGDIVGVVGALVPTRVGDDVPLIIPSINVGLNVGLDVPFKRVGLNVPFKLEGGELLVEFKSVGLDVPFKLEGELVDILVGINVPFKSVGLNVPFKLEGALVVPLKLGALDNVGLRVPPSDGLGLVVGERVVPSVNVGWYVGIIVGVSVPSSSNSVGLDDGGCSTSKSPLDGLEEIVGDNVTPSGSVGLYDGMTVGDFVPSIPTTGDVVGIGSSPLYGGNVISPITGENDGRPVLGTCGAPPNSNLEVQYNSSNTPLSVSFK